MHDDSPIPQRNQRARFGYAAWAVSATLAAGCSESEPSSQGPPSPPPQPTIEATPTAAPTQVPAKPQPAGPLLANVQDVAVGAQRHCALKRDGSVWCWSHGGPAEHISLPQADRLAVVGSSVCSISTKGKIVCAHPGSGDETPISLYRDGIVMTGGVTNYCVRTEDGVLRCGIEDPDKQRVRAPSGLPGLKDPTAFSLGPDHGCAVLDDLWCWTSKDGHPTRPHTIKPVAGARGIAVGRQQTCVNNAAGEIWCYADPLHDEPAQLPSWSGVAGITIAYGPQHPDRLCGVSTAGAVSCSDLRDGTFGPPTPIAGVSQAAQVATGASVHGCARTKAGNVWCWGRGDTEATAVHAPARSGVVPAAHQP